MDRGVRGAGEAGHATGDSSGHGGSGGWPLGLHVMRRLQGAMRSGEQLLSLLQYSRRSQQQQAAAISTSSFSFSSSDLDTESTSSTFFPERSTTLGTLIGIQRPRPHTHALHMRPAGVVAAAAHHRCKPPALHLKAASQKFHGGCDDGGACCCCCPAISLLAACAGPPSHGLHSPSAASLAHLLELERRSAHHPPERDTTFSPCCSFDGLDAGAAGRSRRHRSPGANMLFDGDGVLPPRPSGAPLKTPEQGQFARSPLISSYLSAIRGISRKGKHYHS